MIWTPEHTEVLTRLWLTRSASNIGMIVNRSRKAVSKKADMLGLARKKNGRAAIVWTIEKNEKLKELWNNHSSRQVADEIGVSHLSAQKQASRLGLNPKARNNSIWQEADVNTLKQLWPKVEYTAAAIAAAIGNKNKNAVIGKARRLNLPFKKWKSTNQFAGKPKAPAIKLPKSVGNNATRSMRAALRAAELKQIVERPMPTTGIKLADLERHHCRWPFGESPNLFFCGEARFEERSYCLEHCRIAYETVNQRIARAKERLKVAA